MNTTGWIKIHRKLLEWEWYTDTNTTRVFLHLLLTANFEDKRFRGKEVKRGQVIIGRHSLADVLGLSEQSVRTAINHLISTNEITIETTNKFTIVTICNYDNYQIFENETNQQINQQTNQQLTNNQPTTNQQLTTTKEYKEYKKERMKEERENADKSATQKTLEERQKDFYNELIPFVDKYGNDMIRSFFNYWSQVNKNGKKMLWEMQQAFELPKRLSTWHGKEHASGKNNNVGCEQLYRNNEERMEQAKREGWI